MNYKKTKQKKAQILLMTLIVLMILAIIVVGTIRLTSRDSSQVTANLKYEDFYNTSETKSQDIIQSIADLSASDLDLNLDSGNSASSFLSDNPECIQLLRLNNQVGYECTYFDPSGTGNSDIKNVVSLNQTKFIRDYTLNKDDNFAIQLDGYKDSITLSWQEDQAAIEMRLVYFDDANVNGAWDGNEQLNVINGVYDMSTNGVYSVDSNGSKAVSQDFSITSSTGATQAVNLEPTAFNLNIGTSSGISAGPNMYPLYLTITPRISQNSNFKSIKFSLEADDYSIFPYQVREVRSKTFDTADASTPLVELVSVIPIRPQTDSIFNYSLITPYQVDLPLN